MLHKKSFLKVLFCLLGFGVVFTASANQGKIAGFVGAESCAVCHKSEYESWKGSMHAKFVVPARDGLLKEVGENWAKDKDGNPGPVKANVDGQPYAMEDVVLVQGSKWKQRFLVRNPVTGHHQFLDKQWNAAHELWEPYGNKSDWETKCASCHTTGFTMLEYDKENLQTQKVAFSEMNISCEACHGPGEKHINAAGKGEIFSFKTASVEESSLVCGYCHVRKETTMFMSSQGQKREDQPHPVLGQTYRAGVDDWREWDKEQTLIPGALPGQPVSQNYPDTGLKDAFYLDDKAVGWDSYDSKKHHQEWQEFIQSTHYEKDLLSCASCHSPHAVAGKKETEPRNMCASCHGSTYDVDKIMPGLGSTAKNVGMRTHTFNPHQDRESMATGSDRDVRYFYTK